jgi:hypothetical protein
MSITFSEDVYPKYPLFKIENGGGGEFKHDRLDIL